MFRRIFAACALVACTAVAQAAVMVESTPVVVDAQGQSHRTGLTHKAGTRHGTLYWAPAVRFTAPAKYDTRELGQCAPVRDQGQCGSCWAFSVVKTLESALLRAGKPALDLSEQEVVSCAPAYGCNGGNMDNLDYVVKHGTSLESAWPYTARTGSCRNPTPPVAAKGVRWGYCGSPGKQPTTAQIKQCLLDYGVLSVVVAAGGSDWSRGGHMTGCNVRGQNHMVNLVGFDGDDLLGRNSWGTSWGDKGDFSARQGCDELASGSESVGFIVVDGAGPVPQIPHIALPARVDVRPGTEIALGRHVAEAGVTYAWFEKGVKMDTTESMIYVTPTTDTTYSVKATTGAGTAESSVEVHVIASSDEAR